jgi:hypothetical protein
MANSIEIKIGVDSAEFTKGLRKLDKEINATQKNAEALEKSLQVEFDADRAVKAQDQFQKALELTEQKAEAIRQQLKHLEEAGKIDTADYQKLQTELIKAETKAVDLRKRLEDIKNIDIKQVAKQFEEIGDKIEGAGKKLAPFSAAAAGALVASNKLAKDAIAAGDAIATLSDQYDMSAKMIQRWQYVAMQTDVEAQTLFKSMQKAQSAFAEQAAGGTTAAVKALEALGLSYKNFDSNEEAFQALIERLSSIEDKNLRVAYVTDILGERYASALLPMLNAGTDAIRKYNAEFEAVGYLSDETISHLAELDNEMNKINAQYELAKTELGIALIPVYKAFADLLQNSVIPILKNLAEWFGNLSPSSQKAVIGLLAITAVASPLLILFGKLTSGAGAFIKMLASMNKASLITAAGIGALGAALTLGLNLIGEWKNMSTIEKILKSLALAALVAAGAVAVFHASWSLGLALGAIAAGVTAAIASVKAAEKELTGETTASDYVSSASKGITSGSGLTEQDLADLNDYTRSTAQKSGGTSQTIINSEEDNSTYNINVYVTEPAASAEEIAEIVSKKIATLAQSRG